MIDFLLNLYDVKPDLVLIYHAYNDLAASLTRPFKSDYSHSRRNLGESMHLYKLASFIPYIPSALYNSVVNTVFPYTNARYGILDAIQKNSPDIKNNFLGLDTYQRNIEHIIKVCKASNIDLILSSFAHYLYDHAKGDPTHEKYAEGVKLENEVMEALAKKNNLKFVDNSKLVPKDEKYFVDTIHFTPEGMIRIAENFAVAASEFIEKKFQSRI